MATYQYTLPPIDYGYAEEEGVSEDEYFDTIAEQYKDNYSGYDLDMELEEGYYGDIVLTVSGDEDEIERFERELTDDEVRTKRAATR